MQTATQTQMTQQPATGGRIRVVDSFGAMCGDAFAGDENVLLLPRRLSGAFNALAFCLSRVDLKKRAAFLETAAASRLHRAFADAAHQVLCDMNALQEHGFRPELRVVQRGYYTASVMNYHVDRGESRIICCYNGLGTEFLHNEDALHRNKDRATGAFVARDGAIVQNFHLGDIWRHKGVPLIRSEEVSVRAEMESAFIHRAPKMGFLSMPRLMVVGEAAVQ